MGRMWTNGSVSVFDEEPVAMGWVITPAGAASAKENSFSRFLKWRFNLLDKLDGASDASYLLLLETASDSKA